MFLSSTKLTFLVMFIMNLCFHMESVIQFRQNNNNIEVLTAKIQLYEKQMENYENNMYELTNNRHNNTQYMDSCTRYIQIQNDNSNENIYENKNTKKITPIIHI